jgi:hypothetical protein
MAEELWNIIQIASAGIITLGGAGTIIVALVKWAHKPASDRDDRLKRHDEMLDNDNKRLKALEERQAEMEKSQRLLLKGMEALMRHAIDGNNKEQLQKESDNLHDYIFNK